MNAQALDRMAPDVPTPGEVLWYEKDVNAQPVIHLCFFWSKKCPHCLKARPDIVDIAAAVK